MSFPSHPRYSKGPSNPTDKGKNKKENNKPIQKPKALMCLQVFFELSYCVSYLKITMRNNSLNVKLKPQSASLSRQESPLLASILFSGWMEGISRTLSISPSILSLNTTFCVEVYRIKLITNFLCFCLAVHESQSPSTIRTQNPMKLHSIGFILFFHVTLWRIHYVVFYLS